MCDETCEYSCMENTVIDLKPGATLTPVDGGPTLTVVDGAEDVPVVDVLHRVILVVKFDDGEEYKVLRAEDITAMRKAA